jgi:hypothetical protein
MRQETLMAGLQPSRSMIQTATYLRLSVLTLLARDSSSDRLRDLVRSIRAKPYLLALERAEDSARYSRMPGLLAYFSIPATACMECSCRL